MNKALCAILIYSFFIVDVFAGDLRFQLTTDKPEAVYAAGEQMVFNVLVLDGKEPVADKKVRWKRLGDDGKTETGTLVSMTEPVMLTTSIASPGFVRIELTLNDKEGNPVKNSRGKTISYRGGAGAAPEKLYGVPEPADFDKFWQKQKKALASVEMKATMTPAIVKDNSLIGFDVKVACLGNRPVSGYYVRPKDATNKSLPAILCFHAYGVSGAKMQESFAARGMLAFDINAHGIENGKPKEYYDKLKNGELKNYGLSGNKNPEKSYFLGMFLRIIRALEFLKAQPEWDGRNLIVTGGSQAGMQALAAAGLDDDVSFCAASKPWLCDLGGYKLGRLKGWRPGFCTGILYFDPLNHAKRIKCPVIVDVGLGDKVCPPAGVSAMFNGIKTEKNMFYIQGGTHASYPRGYIGVKTELNSYLDTILKK